MLKIKALCFIKAILFWKSCFNQISPTTELVAGATTELQHSMVIKNILIVRAAIVLPINFFLVIPPHLLLLAVV